MQEELLQFKLQEVWTLMDLPCGKRAIGTKWVFRNKKDERGIVIKNKAKLVAQGHTQEEGTDYDKVFATVARIKAIRLFLAYASFKDFVAYQMDVKSDCFYEKIEEEVYVCQPPEFEDPDFPDEVYKVKKALYGLHQAPKAWYETLSMYLLDNGFHRGKIDKTLFIRRHKDDILLVQVYVDDIIFGSTKKELYNAFEKMMHEKFQMKVKNASTPMETQKPLLKDEDDEEVDIHMYRSMIGSLMYLTSLRHDIMFAVCACARYQVNPKVSHLHAVKRIFREGHLQALIDGKKIIITESTIRRDLQLDDAEGVDCLPNVVIFKQLALMGKPRRMDTELPQTSVPTSVTDEAINEEIDDSLERAATTTRSERVSKTSNDPLLVGVNTPQSEEDSLKLTELMKLCNKLQQRVLDLETTKTTQDLNIDSLKRRLKKLERRKRSRSNRLKRLYKVDLSARVESSVDKGLDLGGEEVFVAQQDEKVIEKEVDADQIQVTTVATTPLISIDEATLAQALAELKHAKPKAKAKGIVFHEPEESTTTATTATTATTSIPKTKSQDKEKAKMIKELNDEEKAKLFMQLLEKRRKFFASKRAKEKRNKPPTQAQQRKIMCTYLKNMEGKKLIDLKNKYFDSIKKMFDRAFKRVNTFVDYRTELDEESSKKTEEKVIKGSFKRVGTELEQESVKKKKIDDDKETDKLKQLVNIIPDEEGMQLMLYL
uniref:Putative ribonuclease H-like domain-containing protein n=1 Tax=Tanacetum cinerariifolium TaxID=118510 RepID=A0A6L2NMZ4_TANCI|nr:putative ribonuclease H-like domain-containing protein [Tanacetum cinerariifolium]GEX77308.1 putative ribonuclease H-like domain-containing protein [Tanacetum cinerariifolium]